MSQEILLTDLNAVEACGGNRGQFVGEFSGNGQGGNSGFHGVALLSARGGAAWRATALQVQLVDT